MLNAIISILCLLFIIVGFIGIALLTIGTIKIIILISQEEYEVFQKEKEDNQK